MRVSVAGRMRASSPREAHVRSLVGRGRAGILESLADRCALRLQRILMQREIDRRRAEAHAIRILLRRVGTRTTVAKIMARKRVR